MKVTDFKHYIGDINLEYGGTFFDLHEWQWGYVPALRVTDLDSGCGFDGAVMIERITIVLRDDLKTIQSIINSCDMRQRTRGQSYSDSEKMEPEFVRAMINDNPSTSTKLEIAYCFMSYGLYDPVSDYGGAHRWIIQTESDPEWADMEYDGWTADVRLSEEQSLFEYLLENGYLADFE